MGQYKKELTVKQLHESNSHTDSVKSNFSRMKVLDWLKTVQYANAEIEPAKETDVMSISSDSSEENNSDSDNNCTSSDKRPGENFNKKRCIDIGNSSNISLIKEGHAEKEFGKNEHEINFKQSYCDSFQFQKAINNQCLKGKNHTGKKRKLPKLTSLTDIQLNSVPNNVYSEKILNCNRPNYTRENIKSKSVQVQDNFLSNIASNIREIDSKVDDEIICDEELNFINKFDKDDKTIFFNKINYNKNKLFNKDESACENTLVFQKKADKKIKINSDENYVSCRTSMDKSLENFNTNVLHFCNDDNTKNNQEAFSGSESEKTQNFEKTEIVNNHGAKKDRNIENSEFDRKPRIIDNESDYILILSGDEIEAGHNSEDKESEATKHFDDNESQVTCDFENTSNEKKNVLDNNAKAFTLKDDRIKDSYAFVGNECNGTQSFKNDRGENTNSIQSNDITINQYCMDDKSEKSHILINSDSDATQDFENNKDQETSNDFTENRIQYISNYENDSQRKEENTYTYNDIDSEKIKKNEIRKNKIKMYQNLSDFFSIYTNIEAPFDDKILISSDDENEDTFIINDENRTRTRTKTKIKEKENDINHMPYCTNSEVSHKLENNSLSDGESDKTRSFNERDNIESFNVSEKTQSFNESENIESFNESEKTQSFNESGNNPNHVLTRTVTEVENDGNILNNGNDCVVILSDCESDNTNNFMDANSESTDNFNDNESVETRNFENISGEKTNSWNNDDNTCTSTHDKREYPFTLVDNESEGTHSFKGEYDENINTIQSNDEGETSHILINSDTESDTTHNFEDQKPGISSDYTKNQIKCTQYFEKDKEQIDGHIFHNDGNKTASQEEENENLNNIPNNFHSEDESTRSFNGSEKYRKNEFGKKIMNIFQDEISTDSFQSSSDIEIIL